MVPKQQLACAHRSSSHTCTAALHCRPPYCHIDAGLVLRPLPIAGVCTASTAVCIWSGLLTHAEAFAGFAESVVCLIVSALLMAQAVDKSGLGARVSLLCIAAVGGTALGLTYALMAADLVLALAVPSTTAREGGIFLPVIRGISASFASYPGLSAHAMRTHAGTSSHASRASCVQQGVMRDCCMYVGTHLHFCASLGCAPPPCCLLPQTTMSRRAGWAPS